LKYEFILLESENIGYGSALNLAIEYCQSEFHYISYIFGGNLDITYHRLPNRLPDSKCVLIPTVLEKKRNRNPFLSKLQYKSVLLHKKNIVNVNSIIFKLITVFTRFLGIFPSPIWAVHGSLFCFHIGSLKAAEKIFNENSFLYCEEMEFASFMHEKGIEFIESEVVCVHESHAATAEVVFETNSFQQFWKVSYKNWMERWL